MKYNPFETVPIVGPVNPEVLAGDLSRDFPLSFRFSQGDAGVQRNLHTLIAATYAHVYTPEGFSEMLPQSLADAENTIDRVRPPRNHTPRNDDEIQTERAKQWGNFKNILEDRATNGAISDREFRRKVNQLNFAMQLTDFRHTARGRPRPGTGSRNYDSYYRQFVMEQEQPNSLPFTVIFGAMRRQLMRHSWPMSFFAADRAGWDYRHPNEPFMSDAFEQDLRESGSLYQRAALHAKWATYYAVKIMMPSVDRQITKADRTT